MSTAETIKFFAIVGPYMALGGVIGAIFGAAIPWGIEAQAHGFDVMQAQSDVNTHVFWSTIAGLGVGSLAAYNHSRN